MLITDLMMQTLPSDRMYEFNLNYILSKIKEFQDILDNKIDDLILKEVQKILISFKLDYDKTSQTVYLTGGAKIA